MKEDQIVAAFQTHLQFLASTALVVVSGIATAFFLSIRERDIHHFSCRHWSLIVAVFGLPAFVAIWSAYSASATMSKLIGEMQEVVAKRPDSLIHFMVQEQATTFATIQLSLAIAIVWTGVGSTLFLYKAPRFGGGSV